MRTLVIALLVVVAACGHSDSARFCDLQADNGFDQALSGDSVSEEVLDGAIQVLDEMVEIAPSEIRSEVETVSEFSHALFEILVDADFDVTQVDAAVLEAWDPEEFYDASERINSWALENCGDATASDAPVECSTDSWDPEARTRPGDEYASPLDQIGGDPLTFGPSREPIAEIRERHMIGPIDERMVWADSCRLVANDFELDTFDEQWVPSMLWQAYHTCSYLDAGWSWLAAVETVLADHSDDLSLIFAEELEAGGQETVNQIRFSMASAAAVAAVYNLCPTHMDLLQSDG